MDPYQQCFFKSRLSFSDSQAAIISLLGFVNNSKIVRECRRCFTFLGGSPVSHWCGHCWVDELARAPSVILFNPFQSTWVCQFPRSNWPSDRNSSGTPTYHGSVRSPTPPLSSLGHQCIESVPISYLDLVVTLSRSQWPCLQDTVLWILIHSWSLQPFSQDY